MGAKPDVEKARFWRKAVPDAARSGLSTREFCRQRKLHESVRQTSPILDRPAGLSYWREAEAAGVNWPMR